MIQHWWPSLLKIPGFLKEFVTPIVKVTKGKEQQMFFTLNEYHEWKRSNNNGKGWSAKYYKGLGKTKGFDDKTFCIFLLGLHMTLYCFRYIHSQRS